MIVRIFCARVAAGSEDEFARMLRDVSTALLERQDGLLGYIAGRPPAGVDGDFMMISLWDDLASVEAFAGRDWQEAVIPEEEVPLITSSTMHHYEVVAERLP